MSAGNNLCLFYSKKCEKSIKLIREYNLNGLKLVNIDTDPYPPQINMVPCLMNGSGQIMFGKQLFDWAGKNDNVLPFQFGHNNNMNTGFSYINSENDYYAEPEEYSSF